MGLSANVKRTTKTQYAFVMSSAISRETVVLILASHVKDHQVSEVILKKSLRVRIENVEDLYIFRSATENQQILALSFPL